MNVKIKNKVHQTLLCIRLSNTTQNDRHFFNWMKKDKNLNMAKQKHSCFLTHFYIDLTITPNVRGR